MGILGFGTFILESYLADHLAGHSLHLPPVGPPCSPVFPP